MIEERGKQKRTDRVAVIFLHPPPPPPPPFPPLFPLISVWGEAASNSGPSEQKLFMLPLDQWSKQQTLIFG